MTLQTMPPWRLVNLHRFGKNNETGKNKFDL